MRAQPGYISQSRPLAAFTSQFSVLGLSLCLLLGGGLAQELDPVEALAEVIPGEPGWLLSTKYFS